MNGKQLFEKLEPNLLRIGAAEQNLVFFQEIQMNLQNVEVIDHFHQIKKNDKGDGLAFEIMFFDKHFIYDIVITKSNVDFVTVLLSCVNMTYIETNFSHFKNNKGEVNIVDKLQFTISYGGDLRRLVYVMDTKRFTEMHRIKNNLLKTIQK
jgi:hypothetical protein